MLLRLYGQHGESRWAYADTPPYDAILVDASAPESASLPPVRLSSRHVLRLTRGNASSAQGGDALPRPLHAHKFRHWLDQVGLTLRTVPSTAPAESKTPIPDEDLAPPSYRSDAPVNEQDAQSSTEQVVVPDAAQAIPPADAPRYRLLRWPRQGVLRGDAQRIRMATLLSRRAMNAFDLVSLTGFTPHQCEVFLQVLQASALLAAEQPAAPAHNAASALPSAKPPSALARPRFTEGLITGLRKRLGL